MARPAKGEEKNTTSQIGIRVDKERRAKIEHEGKIDGLSISDVGRLLWDEAIAAREAKRRGKRR